jgi:hypothetical protein
MNPDAMPSPTFSAALLDLLRGEGPRHDFPAALVETALRRYDCGGYLQALWARDGRIGALPEGWAAGIAAVHRKTAIDNLVALAEFRAIGRILEEESIPFVLLKGAAYLVDLYDEPGQRALTDIDLLIRRDDAGRVARRLAGAGYRGVIGRDFPGNRRFEMSSPGDAAVGFEFHWALGLPNRFGVDAEEVWRRAGAAVLEGVSCLRASPEDALLYHVAHLADHYFGPSLKWLVDLRLMFRSWPIDREALAGRSAAWRVRTALYLALLHFDRVFPGEAPAGLMERVAPGSWRRVLLHGRISPDPLELFSVTSSSKARYPLRCLMLDRVRDAFLLGLDVLLRPVTRPLSRALGRGAPPWEWRD